MSKSIIIIGAGIAGLAAGCYAQLNGYRTEICELHDLPGGLCTAWERKGYIFDGCIHYLFGSAPGLPFNQVWQDLGIGPERRMLQHDEFIRVTDRTDGRTLIAYSDAERLAAHLKELAPGDADHADELADGIRAFASFDLSVMQNKPRALMGPADLLELGRRMTPFMLPLIKWGNLAAEDYAQRWRDPFLRRAIPQMFAWPEIPMMAGLALLAYMAQGNAGFPAGGSLAFAQAIEQRYLALGGMIHYKSQVQRVLVEDDRAVGVLLYDDTEHRADYVVSAADGRGAIFDWLGGRYVDDTLRKRYDGSLPIQSQVQVSYGVRRDLAAAPHWVVYLLDEPVDIAGVTRREIGVKHYCFDPSLAPAGCSSIVVMLKSPYAYWQRIYGRKLYDTEQLQVAEQVMDFLETLYPGLRSDVAVTDVATPLSFERYTGNWQGATCGFLLTKETMRMMIQGVGKTLPGLDNFYMAGQWVEPGGSVPTAAMSGRQAIQMICHADDRPFVNAASMRA